jgi:hypothetical protein
MREKIVLICPTPQASIPAADWHDGQFAHGAYAGIARDRRRNAPSYRFNTADHDPPYELTMSVDRGRPEVAGPGQNGAIDTLSRPKIGRGIRREPRHPCLICYGCFTAFESSLICLSAKSRV